MVKQQIVLLLVPIALSNPQEQIPDIQYRANAFSSVFLIQEINSPGLNRYPKIQMDLFLPILHTISLCHHSLAWYNERVQNIRYVVKHILFYFYHNHTHHPFYNCDMVFTFHS